MSAPYLRPLADGVELEVLVQPRASRTRLVGEHGGRLKIQLAAPPVAGAANAALLVYLAELFGVPRRQVALLDGEGSRRKRVKVEGVDPASAQATLSAECRR